MVWPGGQPVIPSKAYGKAADCDLLIVGAGMVGAVLALACGQAGLRVIVVDSQISAPPPPGGYDLRVSAFTLASRAIFRNLGIWDDLVARRVCPFREMQVWDSRGSGAIHFDAADLGEAQLGYIIENAAIAHAAHAHISRLPTVRYLCPVDLVRLEVNDAWVTAVLSDGKPVTAGLVVGADGGRSQVRRLAGIDSRSGSYGQVAIVANVHTSVPHGEIARQVFLAGGPLAFLPLCDANLSSIVWSCDSGHATSLLGLEDTAFCRQLEEQFGDSLGRIGPVGARAAFPLGFAHADHYVATRVALVGDAAHRVHPLAGQGVNLGLLDAAALAEVTKNAFRCGRDIGAFGTLRRYERWRKGANFMMLEVTDAFKRVFGTDSPPVRAARNFGLTAADAIVPVKRLIMRRAVGLDGDLPPLARVTRAAD